MRKTDVNLSGQWSGQFRYPNHEGPTTPFLANMQDQNGRLGGTILEPDIVEIGLTLEAEIAGHRQGRQVDFTKSYPDARWAYDTPVDYVGRVSSDGDTVMGVWSLMDMDGTFEMHRDTASEECSEDSIDVAVQEPLFHAAQYPEAHER